MLGQNFVDSGDLAQKDLGTALPRRCEREVMVTQCDSFQSFKVILSGDVCEHNSGLASNLSKLLHVTTKKRLNTKRQQKGDKGISLNIPSRSIKLTTQKGASVFVKTMAMGDDCHYPATSLLPKALPDDKT